MNILPLDKPESLVPDLARFLGLFPPRLLDRPRRDVGELEEELAEGVVREGEREVGDLENTNDDTKREVNKKDKKGVRNEYRERKKVKEEERKKDEREGRRRRRTLSSTLYSQRFDSWTVSL